MPNGKDFVNSLPINMLEIVRFPCVCVYIYIYIDIDIDIDIDI